MQYFDSAALDAALGYPLLVDVLEEAFRQGASSPPRQHYTVELDERPAATLLLMPAWSLSRPGAATAGKYIGIKIATVFPDNAKLGKPSVNGSYVLLSATTGEPLAVMDAARLTVWRTAAASALAARHLARQDASRMLMVGAGALSTFLVRAHASVRPIREVAVWNRTPAHAEAVVEQLRGFGFTSSVARDLEAAAREADVISTATITSTPLIRGEWLKPGSHVDCVGAFRPDMRETDDAVVQRARIWVDTRAGALSEAGDILIPLKAGIIRESAIQGDLFELARKVAPVRRSADEITMFKSVGASIEDLAAAVAIFEGGQSS